jgi:hypothetical protein
VHPDAIKWKSGPFSDEEIENAMSSLQNCKAPGHDMVTNDVLKLPRLRPLVTNILNDMRTDIRPGQKTLCPKVTAFAGIAT